MSSSSDALNDRSAPSAMGSGTRRSQGEPLNDDVWIVVPCYNDAPAVGQVVEELRRHFPNIVGVDDGSDDGSARVMREAGARVVRHAVNLGQGAAIQTGIAFALADPRMRYVTTFDADGQHRTEDAVGMLQRAREEGLHVVLGSRFLASHAQMPRGRELLLKSAALFDRMTTGVRLTDSHNGLRVLSREFASCLDLRLSGMAHATEILTQLRCIGLAYAEHPVSIDYTPYSRAKGQRSVNAINIVLDVWVNKLLRGRER